MLDVVEKQLGVNTFVISTVHSIPSVLLDLQETTVLGSHALEGSIPGLLHLVPGIQHFPSQCSVVALVRFSDMDHLPLGTFRLNYCYFPQASVLLLFLLRLLLSNKPPRCLKTIWFAS